MYDVGYIDTKAFPTVFWIINGLTPTEYINKYYKNRRSEILRSECSQGRTKDVR